MSAPRIGIVGGGPAGLMAAEVAAGAGAAVTVYDSMPTFGRKLLMAGKSGLNITHAEDHDRLRQRYGEAGARLAESLDAFGAEPLRRWAAELGVETFVGSSGRVFPREMKASPLLRAWLGRLTGMGVTMATRHRLTSIDERALTFSTPQGDVREEFDAVVLAMGGASWPRLGSDAAWVPLLERVGVGVKPFRPANCAFEVNWSEAFVERFAGQPLKTVTATSAAGVSPGEFVISQWGIEGSLVYAHAAVLRDALEAGDKAVLTIDLVPGRSTERLARDLARQNPKTSFSNRLRKAAGIEGVKLGLLRELTPEASTLSTEALAARIKALPLTVQRTRPIEEAISVAGGVAWDAIDDDFMLKALPGVFVAGEMVDWEAPTGGYLLTACFATGRTAGLAAAQFAWR